MFTSIRNSSDAGSAASDVYTDQTAHFPHTRALLAQIARQYKPQDSYDSDAEGDDFSKVPSAFVTKVVSFLDQEHEDELKGLLRDHYVGMSEDLLEQHVLELMHRHRDDVAGMPFIFLAQNKRPISRPSSRASSHSTRLNRPETPLSAPSSPLAYVFRRPHTPLASPLSTGQAHNPYVTTATAPGDSPFASPVLPYSLPQSYFATSLPASPLSSPRLLNAKATEFRPHPRPLSAASSNPGTLVGSRAETPSPDLWAHNPSRATSNLAIAAPLVPDSSLLSRSGTPSSLRASIQPDEYDEDNDPFDPFNKDVPVFPSLLASDYDPVWDHPTPAHTFEAYAETQSASDFHSPPPPSEIPSQSSQDSFDEEANDLLTGGMTPFDVLASVFGTSLAPSELEEALASNGYDFDRALAWLIDRLSPSPANNNVIHPKTQNVGGRVSLVSRDGAGASGFVRGGRSEYAITGGRGNARFGNGRPVSGGNRVCRYFLAGECLRADCRFSHDLERALCRFWLRGTCAKGETCEFLHQLPQDMDVSTLTSAMVQTNLRNSGSADVGLRSSPPLDDFPSLEDSGRRNGHYNRHTNHYDPSRTRFSAAVKKSAIPAPVFQPRDLTSTSARREAMGIAADSIHHRTAIVAPKPSPRLRLHPPILLPTLPTGESVSQLYMNYRARALQLGAARSACLSRAADAWRRGDGAAAKRFSREGHELNAKMGAEMAQAASKLVRERAVLAEQAVKARDLGWSDDPGDRTTRGQPCGAGLGVVLGISSIDFAGDNRKLSPEERTEVMLDLHALHSNEAVEVLEGFLLALEREHFYGLAYLIVGEEKHTGTQNASRGVSRARLATGVREWLHRWGYPWTERDGVICVDPLTHL